MALSLGSSLASKVYLGATEVALAYLGATQVYSAGGGLDPDVQAFKTESGATDLTGLNNLVVYLKGEGLYSNFVIYPMKSAQNAGSGATVYSLGGVTTNDMTLVNSPTWAAGGITLNGTTQYGHIADFLGSETLTSFSRVNKTSNTTAVTTIWGQYDTGANARSVLLAQDGTFTGDPIELFRSSNGTTGPALEGYTNSTTGLGSDNTFVAQWIDGGGRSLWVNKSAESLTLNPATFTQTAKFNASVNITFGAFLSSGSPTGYSAQTGIAQAFCNTTLTTTQREIITDYINAL